MKLRIQITETASLFHFISNLTDWHFSVRSSYKDKWLQQGPSLTLQEKKVLNKLEKVFQKYTFGDKYWGKVFLAETDDMVWSMAKQVFSPGDLVIFKKASEIFYPRFLEIWKKEKHLLLNWEKILKQRESQLFPKGLFDDLNTFFGFKTNAEELKIILLLGGGNQFPAGGANIGEGLITLEISWVDFNAIRPVILSIWHELTHSLWKNTKYDDLLEKTISESVKKKTMPPYLFDGIPLGVVINEAVVESLFSHGYLAEKHFSFPTNDFYRSALSSCIGNPENSMNNWRIVAGFHLISLSSEYIEDKKTIDKDYLQHVIELLVKFSSNTSH